MSALWTREPFQLELPVEVSQPFQVRDVPFVYPGGSYYKTAKYKQPILANAFQKLETNCELFGQSPFSHSLEVLRGPSLPEGLPN